LPKRIIPAVADAQVQHSILVHFGELGLKGRNQPMFRRQLRRNLRRRLGAMGLDWPIDDAVGVFVIRVPHSDANRLTPAVLDAVRNVFGVVWIAAARRLPPHRFTIESRPADVAQIQEHLLDVAKSQYAPEKSFCVRVNRGNKRLPFASPELAAELGQIIRDHTPWQRVNLKAPDITFNLDLRCAGTYVYGEKLRGPGGLPVGTSGRVLALLSGGIDSPVAAYLMAKRGCRVDFIHFTAGFMQREEAVGSKVWELARHLGQFTLGSRLFLVPYAHFDVALTRQKVGYQLVLFRRFMVRVAEKLAGQIRARALVTGDNLSQVASQTLSNLISTSQATGVPIFRPILAFDKQETIALAERIGTYPISIRPYQDCCALISQSPKTRSRHKELAALEALSLPDYAALIEQTLADAICLDTRNDGDGPGAVPDVST
jgi:thiamine biosynthesis protein ThiI